MCFSFWHFSAFSLAAGAALVLRGPLAGGPKPGPAGAPVPILFVGNSFTRGAHLPGQQYNAAAVADEKYGQPRARPAKAVRPNRGPRAASRAFSKSWPKREGHERPP